MATSATALSSTSSPASPSGEWRTREARPSWRLLLVIATNGMLRVAGGASGVLVAVSIADLAERGYDLGAGVVGTLAAIAFGTELLGAVPLGLLSDAVSTRMVMTSGAVLAALATWLFGLSHDLRLFVVSRALEGVAAAAGVPALLAYLTEATADDPRLRARVMSYFELSLLGGLALGGIVGGRLWVDSTPAPSPPSPACTASRHSSCLWGAREGARIAVGTPGMAWRARLPPRHYGD